MSKFVILKRLGISRGWRIQLPNRSSLYAVSLLHCIFIYSFLKSKAIKLGFWILSYFIVCFWKKYLIHIFYWKIPGIKKNRMFGLRSCLKIKYRRKFTQKKITRLGVFFSPTKFVFLKLKKLKKKMIKKKINLVSLKYYSTVWNRSSLFFNFIFNKVFASTSSQFAKGFIKDNSGFLNANYSFKNLNRFFYLNKYFSL